jgi:hypothetical protein
VGEEQAGLRVVIVTRAFAVMPGGNIYLNQLIANIPLQGFACAHTSRSSHFSEEGRQQHNP